MSAPARDLVQRLLERKPVKRIGMLQGRADDIKKHAWFAVRTLLVQPRSAFVCFRCSGRGFSASLVPRVALRTCPFPWRPRALTGAAWPLARWSPRAGQKTRMCPSARRSWRTATRPTRWCPA